MELDIDSMEYLLNGEVVSVHYINETDQFFYLRKDVVDMILSKFRGKLRHHLYERRMVDSERGLRNWWKHQQKLVNAGELKLERAEDFERLLTLCEEFKRINQYG